MNWEFDHYSGSGEYFLVENRQNDATAGYDDGLPGCGLLIWHIDESVTYSNYANSNEAHALVWVEQADGLNELANTGDRGDPGDPWPGVGTGTPKYDFNSTTTPNSNLYSGSASLVSVHVDSTSCSSSMQADLTYEIPAPGAFTKTSPADTAVNQNTHLVLDWSDAGEAAGYDYCLETPADGSCDSWTTGLTASQVMVSGLTVSSTYEWQVRAVNPGGTTLADGGTLWTFLTTDFDRDKLSYLPYVKKAIGMPSAFTKLSPANGATGISNSPDFDWDASTDASSYDFCYDSTVDGTCTGSWTPTGSSTGWTLSGLAYSSTYEWQVRANNAAGTLGANGGTKWRFTTQAAPVAWTIVTARISNTPSPIQAGQ